MRWLCTLFIFLLVSSPAIAYIGPGAGMGAIGTVLALIGAFLLLIVGFVWYPVKRFLARKKNAIDEAENTMEEKVEIGQHKEPSNGEFDKSE